jgi:hypothetical protein
MITCLQTPEGSQLLDPAAYENGSVLTLIQSLYASEPRPASVVLATLLKSHLMDPSSSNPGLMVESEQRQQDTHNSYQDSTSSSSDHRTSQGVEVEEPSATSDDYYLPAALECALKDCTAKDATATQHQTHDLRDKRPPESSCSRIGEVLESTGPAVTDVVVGSLEADPSLSTTAAAPVGPADDIAGTSGMAGMAERLAAMHEQEEEDVQSDLGVQQEQSMARLQQVEERLAGRSQLQDELSQYVEGVKERLDEAGDKLVELPPGYMLMVEQMLQEARAHSEALFGWDGPRRQVYPLLT